MNGVYFCEGIDFSKTNNIGIENKIEHQIKCLKDFSKVNVIASVFKDNLFEKIKFLLPFIKSDREYKREELLKRIDNKTNYIYIRKPALCFSFYKLLKKIKKMYPSVYIIMEIPTFPFHSEYYGISRLMNLKSIGCEKKLKEVIDIIVTFSSDDFIWGIKTIKTSNCICYNEILPRSENYKPRENELRLTCVANFTYWHGLDRLINGINNYNGKYKIRLNVVGGGREINNLKKLSRNSKSIIFHGPKIGQELDDIFNETDIAVDALGRHRSGVFYNSSLKGKEYCARGIPSISAVKTELDYLDDYHYYLKIPADESNVDIKEIISFFEKIYFEKNENVTDIIRNKTYKLFDYKYGFEEKLKSILYAGDNNE